jgi:hypothetical protein
MSKPLLQSSTCTSGVIMMLPVSEEWMGGSDPDGTDIHFERLAALCLALPEATSTSRLQHTQFSVRNRTFAYHLVDHHGDGGIALCCKAPADMSMVLAQADPRRYFIPPSLGARGWVGLDLGVGEIDWNEVQDLVIESYRLVAPRRLAALVP